MKHDNITDIYTYMRLFAADLGERILERYPALHQFSDPISPCVSTSGGAPPVGPFRLGLSHAVAQPDISKVIVDLGKQFPLLQPHISNDISSSLLTRLRLGELDGALVVLPKDAAVTLDLDGVTLAQEEMQPVQARTLRQSRSGRCAEFYRRHWILNPVGCLVREEIKKRVERLGVPLVVAAELHSPGLQLSLIAKNAGVGVVRTSFLRAHPLRTRLRVIEHSNFSIAIRIVFFRGRYLGTREQVALELQRMLAKHFENAAA